MVLAEMDSKTVEDEIISHEKAYWQAIKDRDVDAMTALTDFPCLILGAQGVASIDEAHLAAMLKGAAWAVDEFSLGDNLQVRFLSDDTAIVAYTVHEALTVEGEPVALDAADASLWVRRDGRWRCAMHTESILGDPFGRDRA